MPTTRETALAALHARLQPLAALTLRDEVLPERIPAAGLMILRDGQPGKPEVTLSPLLSCSRRMPITCSSVNFNRFIVRSSPWAKL